MSGPLHLVAVDRPCLPCTKKRSRYTCNLNMSSANNTHANKYYRAQHTWPSRYLAMYNPVKSDKRPMAHLHLVVMNLHLVVMKSPTICVAVILAPNERPSSLYIGDIGPINIDYSSIGNVNPSSHSIRSKIDYIVSDISRSGLERPTGCSNNMSPINIAVHHIAAKTSRSGL